MNKMTEAESIIMSAALRSKMRTSADLAFSVGMPLSTMRDKMKHPEKLRLSDLNAFDKYCRFTEEEALRLIRRYR